MLVTYIVASVLGVITSDMVYMVSKGNDMVDMVPKSNAMFRSSVG
jgi:hypothetical protein